MLMDLFHWTLERMHKLSDCSLKITNKNYNIILKV
jgi:hypothetical protein